MNKRKGWVFVIILYIARFHVLMPIMILNRFIFTDAQQAAASLPEGLNNANPAILFLALVVVSPLIETLVECTLPYLVISYIRDYRYNRPKRCWGFVAISACVMALLHPMLAAILPSLITGAFLAYCYAHFATRSAGQAILATTVFHSGINMVGFAMILIF